MGLAYELIAGERRLRACRIAGFKTVPCIVSDCDEKQSAIFAMLENLQRQDLQLFEEAEGIQRLIAEWGVTQEEAAHAPGQEPIHAGPIRCACCGWGPRNAGKLRMPA